MCSSKNSASEYFKRLTIQKNSTEMSRSRQNSRNPPDRRPRQRLGKLVQSPIVSAVNRHATGSNWDSEREKLLIELERELERRERQSELTERENERLRALLAKQAPVQQIERPHISFDNIELIRGKVIRFIRDRIDPNAETRDELVRAHNLSAFGIIVFDVLSAWMRSNRVRAPHISIEGQDRPINNNSIQFPPSQLLDTMDRISERDRPQEVPLITDIWRVLLKFFPSTLLLPEEQFRSGLWARLLDVMLLDPIQCDFQGFRYGPEFRMKNIPAYLGVDSRADYAGFFTVPYPEPEGDADPQTSHHILPFILVEACAPRLLNLPHKDFSKLAVQMHASVLSMLGALDNPQHFISDRPLVVFGFLTSITQVQLCMLSAWFSRINHWSFVFQAPPQWSFDLAGTNYELPELPGGTNQNASIIYSFATSIPRGVLRPLNPAQEAALLRAMQPHTANRAENWPNNINLHEFEPKLVVADEQLQRLTRFNTFCHVIREQVAWYMTDVFTPGNLRNSPNSAFTYPPEFKDILPKSRKSATTESPARGIRTPGPADPDNSESADDYDPVREVHRYAQHNRLNAGKTEVVHKHLAWIPCYPRGKSDGTPIATLLIKKYVEHEWQAFCRLKSANHIVRIYDARKLDHFYVVYHMDYLTHDRQIPFSSVSEAVAFSVNVVLDGLWALKNLRESQILHRDISRGNFLYCPLDGKWKLTDFDLAIILPDSGNDHTFTDSVCVGTEGYIAPEVQKTYQYTFASDLYGMGKTLEELILRAVMMITVSSYSEWSELLYDLQRIVFGMVISDREKRSELDNILDEGQALCDRMQNLKELDNLDD